MPPKSSTASIQPVNFFCFVRGGGSESGNPRGHFGPRLNVTAKPTKLKPKLFLNSFWFSSKSCSTGIFINRVRSFFDTENKKCCSFQEFFTVTNIISIRKNRCSIPCVYLYSYEDGCLDGKKLLPFEKVEMRDAVESLYWPEMAYVEIPLMLNRSKKIIEAAYIHVRPVIRWLNCLEYMRSCWDQMRQ